MMTNTNHTALITGASAGIGATFARFLAEKGFNLLLVARREDRLQALAQELNQQYKVKCSVFAADLNNPQAPKDIINYAKSQNITIDVLVNNAGLAGNKKIMDTPWEVLAGEIQVMLTATTELIYLTAPAMKAQGYGRIINVSSLAALAPPAASSLYTAIKSYVLLMSQAMDMELKPHGVHVTALCPGFTYSEFHDVMGTRKVANKLPKVLWQQPEDVVAEAYSAVMKGKPVCVSGAVNKVIAGMVRPLSESMRYTLGVKLNPFQ